MKKAVYNLCCRIGMNGVIRDIVCFWLFVAVALFNRVDATFVYFNSSYQQRRLLEDMNI